MFFLLVFSDILVDEANWFASFEEDLHGISTRFKAGFLSRKPTASRQWDILHVRMMVPATNLHLVRRFPAMFDYTGGYSHNIPKIFRLYPKNHH